MVSTTIALLPVESEMCIECWTFEAASHIIWLLPVWQCWPCWAGTDRGGGPSLGSLRRRSGQAFGTELWWGDPRVQLKKIAAVLNNLRHCWVGCPKWIFRLTTQHLLGWGAGEGV